VVRAALSVPDEDGVIVFDFEARRTLAYRKPSGPAYESACILIGFNGPPLSPADPRSRAPSGPLAAPAPPAEGTQGGTP
jgi:hypothetical protein